MQLDNLEDRSEMNVEVPTIPLEPQVKNTGRFFVIRNTFFHCFFIYFKVIVLEPQLQDGDGVDDSDKTDQVCITFYINRAIIYFCLYYGCVIR